MRWASVATFQSWEDENARKIEVPWRKLSKVIRPRGGNVGVIIAAPGVGKTTLGLNWVNQTNARTLYCSADTNPADVTAQLASMVTGHDRVIVEKRLEANDEWKKEYANAVYRSNPNLVVDFDPSPSTRSIWEKSVALTELWAATPEVVVIDTASNIEMSDRGDNAEWQRVWLACKDLARNLNSFVLLMHHVRQGEAASGRLAPEMSDGLWGSNKFPEFVLGLHTASPTELVVTVRKNRSGKKDVPVRLRAQLEKSIISDPE